ncbi:hypothetical protein niasHT_031459 [Heterodera trifolii]|uniref:Actin n=1 Tax=Heterodera trifolii TaxID=157864 RepID=A0ABD2IXQ1_9BILA
MDKGAYSIKAGYATDQSRRYRVAFIFLVLESIVYLKQIEKFFQHCVQIEGQRKRIFVADELDQCTDGSALFSVLPFERGYLGSQLGHAAADLEPPVRHGGRRPRRGLLSVPPGAHRPQRSWHSSACTAQAHCLAHNPCCVVVDSGHSFTHIVPFVGGQIVRDLNDIGGKALTNQLKDWISYRQLHMMDETYLVNWCKDDCCFVSTDFQRDMDRWRANRVDCVLPDFMHTTRGHVLHWGDASNRLAHKNTVDEQQQKVTLCVERFALPELLIRPGDAEVQQMGIPEHCVRPLNGWQRTSSLSTSPPPNAPISPAIKAARDDEAFRMQQHNSASGVPRWCRNRKLVLNSSINNDNIPNKSRHHPTGRRRRHNSSVQSRHLNLPCRRHMGKMLVIASSSLMPVVMGVHHVWQQKSANTSVTRGCCTCSATSTSGCRRTKCQSGASFCCKTCRISSFASCATVRRIIVRESVVGTVKIVPRKPPPPEEKRNTAKGSDNAKRTAVDCHAVDFATTDAAIVDTTAKA